MTNIKTVFDIQEEIQTLHPELDGKTKVKMMELTGEFSLNKIIQVEYTNKGEISKGYAFLLNGDEWVNKYVTIGETVKNQIDTFIAKGITLDDINTQVDKFIVKHSRSEKTGRMYYTVEFLK